MKQKIIIFDGPDMCGKTEMACKLSDIYNVPYFKKKNEWEFFEKDPSYFKNALTYGDPYFASYLEQTKASVIMDRWYPSEWVYSRVFNRGTNDEVLERVDSMIAALGGKIIIPFRTSYEGLVDMFESVTPEKMQEIEGVYREFAKWTKCPVLFLNVDDENLQREINEIVPFYNQA